MPRLRSQGKKKKKVKLFFMNAAIAEFCLVKCGYSKLFLQEYCYWEYFLKTGSLVTLVLTFGQYEII
jgi:hypothetical protein